MGLIGTLWGAHQEENVQKTFPPLPCFVGWCCPRLLHSHTLLHYSCCAVIQQLAIEGGQQCTPNCEPYIIICASRNTYVYFWLSWLFKFLLFDVFGACPLCHVSYVAAMSTTLGCGGLNTTMCVSLDVCAIYMYIYIYIYMYVH